MTRIVKAITFATGQLLSPSIPQVPSMPKNESSGIAAYVNRLVDNRCDLGDTAEVARVCHSLALAILRAVSYTQNSSNSILPLSRTISLVNSSRGTNLFSSCSSRIRLRDLKGNESTMTMFSFFYSKSGVFPGELTFSFGMGIARRVSEKGGSL